jgi:hypothetical protein
VGLKLVRSETLRYLRHTWTQLEVLRLLVREDYNATQKFIAEASMLFQSSPSNQFSAPVKANTGSLEVEQRAAQRVLVDLRYVLACRTEWPPAMRKKY